MAQIIDFELARGARPSRASTALGNAEILFFLGVRYERMPDGAPQAPFVAEAPKRSVKRARKRRA